MAATWTGSERVTAFRNHFCFKTAPFIVAQYAGDGESQQVDLQQDQRGERLVE
jgi:hypothetical protein